MCVCVCVMLASVHVCVCVCVCVMLACVHVCGDCGGREGAWECCNMTYSVSQKFLNLTREYALVAR